MIRKLVTNQSNKAALQMPCVRVDRNNPIIMEDYLPRVVEDLLDTATDLKDKCAGLSSNQIGYGAHAFAVKFGAEYIVLVNAEIISRDGGINAAFERCLSLVNKGGYMLPGVKKRRHKRIKVRFNGVSFAG